MIEETTPLLKRIDAMPAIPWNDFREATRITRDLLAELANDKNSLRILTDRIASSPELLAQCECHELLERLDLYDGRDRNFQIRFNFTTPNHSVRPHDHRYSFSTFILRGKYKHIWFDPGQAIYDNEADEQALNHLDKNHPDSETGVVTTRMTPLFVTTESVGAQYTIHHSTVHATITTPESLSIIIKGPGEKSRSLIADRESGKIWWRFGRQMENLDRVNSKKMSFEYYQQLRSKLSEWGITQ
ncbi:hypothetical protein IB270_33195 [Ensifer sp. ENS05]|uniref:hypothetical protein n=1 Tax=Ensifer sp. ENS05 TaxID=2769277 RepID=UPI00177B9073|nr:hypothetical protein [Ensifer sp. ENS05]MBD9597682.1 hypothetical protein [Ensifer sp. ENS05]